MQPCLRYGRKYIRMTMMGPTLVLLADNMCDDRL